MPFERPPGAAARRALEHIDRALAARPKKDGNAFSEAVACLCEVRQALIRWTGGPEASPKVRGELERLNAVISVLIAGHFPLGFIPWEEIEKSRDWVAGLVDAISPGEAATARSAAPA